MGRKSVKQNKNEYQIARESLGLSREAAADLLEYISDDRIEKIENEKSVVRPDEVLLMAEKYKAPELCNHYCSMDCPIGQKYVTTISKEDLQHITVKLLSELNAVEKEKQRLLDISVDGKINSDEKEDFIRIRQELKDIETTISMLTLWVDNALNEGNI